MSGRERRKGVEGERQVRTIFERAGFTVRGLEGAGDHLALMGRLVLHVEAKRQETARPWQWARQAIAEAPIGSLPLVAMRCSRMPWLAMTPLTDFARLLAIAGQAESLALEVASYLNHPTPERRTLIEPHLRTILATLDADREPRT